MSDQENENQNEEEMEEEILINQDEGENQDVYAIEMQINDDIYLIIIGKTDENKIFLRLMEKDDQNKPYFHNEFSLEDLRNINPIFNGIDSEDIAFQYLASNLADAEKDIKIIDDEKINFNIIIADEEDKFEFDFVLFKNIDDNTGENEGEGEAENEGENENEMQEGIEEMINEVNEAIETNDMNEINEVNEGNEGNADIIEKNLPSPKEEKETKEPKVIDNGNKINENILPQKVDEIKQEQVPEKEKEKEKEIIPQIKMDENMSQNMNSMKGELLEAMNNLTQYFNKEMMKQKKEFDNMKEELKKQTDIKINQMKEVLNKKDNEIIELKNVIGNLQQKLNEYDGKITEVNNKFDNINNDNNKLLRNSSRKSEQNNNSNIDSNKIMKEVKDNLKGFENKITEVKNIFEKDKKDKDNNIKILTEKINNIDNKYQKNKGKDDNMKLIAIENGLKALDTKINDYELDQLIENMALLLEKQNDNKIYQIINQLESQINDVKQKLNKKEKETNEPKQRNKYEPELINRINNHENIITKLQTRFNKFQEEKTNENINKNKLSDITRQSNDLKSRLDSLYILTKKLENGNKELNIKTNNLANEISKLSLPEKQEQSPNTQFHAKKISGPKLKYYHTIENQINNQDNQISYYNRTNPNLSNYNISKDSINSKIVNFDDIIFLQNRIKEINPKIKEVYFSLVYRASEDGDKASDFHKKCDRIGPNIVIIKTRKGTVFGGFTFRNWEHLPRDIDVNRPNLGSASRDSNAFGFNVNNQKIYNNEKPNEFAIWCNRNFGPTFKNNLFQIFDSCLRKGGYCNLRRNSHFGGQMFDYEISGGESRFKVDDLEVFEVKLL